MDDFKWTKKNDPAAGMRRGPDWDSLERELEWKWFWLVLGSGVTVLLLACGAELAEKAGFLLGSM